MARHQLLVYVAIVLLATLIPDAWTAHLPEGAELPVNHLDTLAPHDTLRQLPHESYDLNDDVANEIPHAVADGVGGTKGEQEATHERNKRSLSDWLIAPNTRWCGRGNTANGTYNHLGGASAADKCCRKHDHCQVYIPAMSNRYELFNYRPYTLSHCNCDRRFRTCLKMANDDDAKTIGKLFFNMVQTQCFVLKTEQVCQTRSEDGTCEREYSKHKAYLKNNKRF